MYLVYLLHSWILDEGYLEGSKMSVAQIQVNYKTRELYIVAIVLKHKKYFLIILLLHILWVVIWNSIRLMKNEGFSS